MAQIDELAVALAEIQASNSMVSASLADVAVQLGDLVTNLAAASGVSAADLQTAQNIATMAATLAASASASDAQLQAIVTSTTPASGA